MLEGLRDKHPIINEILRYRGLMKLKSTYCEGLLKVIDNDGRIHSNFNQTETRTGRISSTEPNLQNIPVRTELGREMRKFFSAKEGCVKQNIERKQNDFLKMQSEMTELTKDITKKELKKTCRISTPYEPTETMKLPIWDEFKGEF